MAALLNTGCQQGRRALVVIRRMGLAVVVAAVALAGFTGLSTGTGTAAAASRCGDYHFIGAAGSGQRDDATVNRGSTAIVPGVGEGVERRRLTREVSEATQHGPPIVEP
jgi:hypothetical protein